MKRKEKKSLSNKQQLFCTSYALQIGFKTDNTSFGNFYAPNDSQQQQQMFLHNLTENNNARQGCNESRYLYLLGINTSLYASEYTKRIKYKIK